MYKLLIICLVMVFGVLPASAAAGVSSQSSSSRNMEYVIQDDAEFLHRSDARLAETLAHIKRLGFTRIRVTAGWKTIAPNPLASQAPQFDGADPAAYPAENWYKLDRLVFAANQAGIPIMMDIAMWAPVWATSDSANVPTPKRDINAQLFADYSVAIARRYSGSFHPAGYPAPLPRVDMFSIWNEPNITAFFMPQWYTYNGKKYAASPHAYRQMVALSYPRIKQWRPDSTVLIGGLACCGSYQKKSMAGGVPPARFIREMACVDAEFRPLRLADCQDFSKVAGDGFSHHPYSFSTTPATTTPRDNLVMGDLPRMHRILKRLVRMGRFSPALANIYITEYGYFASRSQRKQKVTPAVQARMGLASYRQAERLPYVKMHAQFLLRDLPCAIATDSCNNWPTGIFFEGRDEVGTGGSAKPLYRNLELGVFAWKQGRATNVWVRVSPGLQVSAPELQYFQNGSWRKIPLALRANNRGTLTVKIRNARFSRVRLVATDANGTQHTSMPAPIDRLTGDLHHP